MFRRRRPLSWLHLFKELFWPKAGWRRVVTYLKHRVLRLRASPYAIATGFSCGVALSFTPLVGFHFIIAALLAWPLRGNILAAALGTLVGNPITFPIMWGPSYQIGLILLGRQVGFTGSGTAMFMEAFDHLTISTVLNQIGEITFPWLLGSMITGPIAAVIAFCIVRVGVATYRKQRDEAKLQAEIAKGSIKPAE